MYSRVERLNNLPAEEHTVIFSTLKKGLWVALCIKAEALLHYSLQASMGEWGKHPAAGSSERESWNLVHPLLTLSPAHAGSWSRWLLALCGCREGNGSVRGLTGLYQTRAAQHCPRASLSIQARTTQRSLEAANHGVGFSPELSGNNFVTI